MALMTYTGLNVVTVNLSGNDSVKILPGVNEIEDDLIENFKKHPSVAQRLKDGKFIILSEGKADRKKSVEDMLAYIPKIYDTRLLKKIIKEDGREDVVGAAKKQLDTIVVSKKEEVKEENEHFK